jgi:hypothetical protein
VQQLLALFFMCAIVVGVHHRVFSCHFQVSKLFLYPFKVLLSLLFGVHVFVMVGVMFHFVPFYHFLRAKSWNGEIQRWLLSSPS